MNNASHQSYDYDSDRGRGQGGAGAGGRAGVDKGSASCLQSYLTLGLTVRTDMRRE